MAQIPYAEVSRERMSNAVERVRQRLLRDRVHLRDLMDVGLVDATWLERVPAALRTRLQELLDNPDS